MDERGDVLSKPRAGQPVFWRSWQELSSILYSHSPYDDVKRYQKEELTETASLVELALRRFRRGEPAMDLVRVGPTRAAEPITVLTVVNENKPFLLDSMMSTINELGIKIYLVTHPILTLALDDNGRLVINNPSPTGATSFRVSIIQFHLQPLSEGQAKALISALEKTLDQVYAAVRDWQPMVQEVKELIDGFRLLLENRSEVHSRSDERTQQRPHTRSLAQTSPDAIQRVTDFLSWLVANNFTFLGMRQYTFDPSKDPENAFRAQGVKLGILNDHTIHILADPELQSVPKDVLAFMESNELLIVTKANARSHVHRPTWLDYIGVKLFDAQGQLNGEMRIVGLFTSTAYTSSVLKIPYLKPKVETIIERLGYSPEDHSGKALINVLETYPRDEMFRTPVDVLAENVRLILELGERPRVRVLTHIDPFGRFVSILAFVPREGYDTQRSEKIGHFLNESFDGKFFECQPLLTEGSLTRLYYVIHRSGSDKAPLIERSQLEKEITLITRNWNDKILSAAKRNATPPEVIELACAFPETYRDMFDSVAALEDARFICALDRDHPIFVHFHRSEGQAEDKVSLKLFHRNEALALSQRVPLLENMGFRVIAEQTLALPDGHGDHVYLHDMQLENAFNKPIDLGDGGQKLAAIFEAVWANEADDDAFNGLTQSADLDWREVVLLRAYGRYLQQAGIPYSQARLAETLNHFPAITRDLFTLFRLKFDPKLSGNDYEQSADQLRQQIELDLQNVPNLDDDLILRRYRNLIDASLRTNFFKPQEDGKHRRTIAIKLNPREVDGLPEPRPYREIFVYGPQVEGVHLRFGKVARGGIRWSDRALDYRTEILGLVKAQQVKNAVIVPVGSKGGFYPHRLPQTNDRAALSEAARQAYIAYIDAMLSITDNIVDGRVVAPGEIIRHDDDDPYFVVAADKGTATFSDTANAISQAKNFWLDDAFASGGSAGYDHKEMGITAKGAFEAVKRHFRELFNRDIDHEVFSVVGVGDMSGDVFGNGMLLSRKTKLIAAFDHRDIFLDPDPDLDLSYEERKRLFNLPRSSWQDYDADKISSGGGVYSRSQKLITLSEQAAKAIGLTKLSATPFEIIHAILQADVDLLWFGGIGTYVRAEHENDADVGDRANDAVRITGSQIKAKVVAEGANLGMTQRGRIEFSLAGGRCDTDAIDNSAGVNCSDVEVNIKIALAAAMRDGQLDREQRNNLLKTMTQDVSALVLRNNYLQPLTLSLAENRSLIDLPYQIRFMNDLERRKLLDRRVEILPNDQTLRDRIAQGKGLTRPETSVLMAYAKLTLEEEIANDGLSLDPYFAPALIDYFPTAMHGAYSEHIKNHPLHREIIATLLANDIVNRGGPTFVNRLADKTGRSVSDIVKAYVAVRDGFEVRVIYDAIDALDNRVPGKLQNDLYESVMTMLFVTTGWVLRNIDSKTKLETLVDAIIAARNTIETRLDELMPDYMRQVLDQKAKRFEKEQVPESLSRRLALFDVATVIPDIALISNDAKANLIATARIYFTLIELFRINRIEQASAAITVVDYYDGLAVAQANDTIAEALRRLVYSIIKHFGDEHNPVEAWRANHASELEDITVRLNSLIEGELNLSRFSVAAGMLANFARASA